MASMYGKDAQNMGRQDDYYPDPPTYKTTNYIEREVQIIEEEPVECTPGMCLHPVALLRWFQLAMFFTLQWLVQITCGNDACTMIMNVFGYTALGQIFVLLIFLLLSIICSIILLLFSLNAHRAYGGAMRAIEKVYVLIAIPLMIICGALGTWMAVLTRDPEVNYQGRGNAHIRGQWIAAAVLEFLMVGVYIFDFWLQGKDDYPFGIKDYQSDAIYATTRQVQTEYETPVTETKHTTTQEQRQYYTTQSMI